MRTNNQPEYGDLVPGITPSLMNFLHNRFHLGKTSIHGPLHWQRVWENGQRLALLNGANLMVVALFAFTHESPVWTKAPIGNTAHGLLI